MKSYTMRELLNTLLAAHKNEKTSQEVKEVIASIFVSKCMLMIAVVMIVYGSVIVYEIIAGEYSNEFFMALDIIAHFLRGEGLIYTATPDAYKLPVPIVYIVCGLLIFLDRRRNFIKSVGLYAFSVGFSKAYASLSLVISQTELTFLIGAIMLGLGSNLCYSGYCMLSGKVRGRNGLMLSAILLLLIYLEYLAMLLYIDVGHQLTPIRQALSGLFESYPTMIISIAMYLILIWLLDTDEIRYGDYITRHVRIMKYVDDTYNSAERLSIPEDVASALLDPSKPGWYDPSDGGPVEQELKFESRNEYGNSRIYVQKWKNCPNLFMTICGTPEGTMTYAKRFEIQKVFEPSGGIKGSDRMDILIDDGKVLHACIDHPAEEDE